MTVICKRNKHTKTAAMATLEGMDKRMPLQNKGVISPAVQRTRNINMLMHLMTVPGALTAEAKARAERTIENLRSQL